MLHVELLHPPALVCRQMPGRQSRKHAGKNQEQSGSYEGCRNLWHSLIPYVADKNPNVLWVPATVHDKNFNQ